MSSNPDFELIASRLRRVPYHQWLGVDVKSVGDGLVVLSMPWRAEFVSNPDAGYTHGGVLATLIDIAGDFAVITKVGRGVPTVDLRVDFHRATRGGTLLATGQIVKMGKSFAVADARIEDESGALIASGRGVYWCGS